MVNESLTTRLSRERLAAIKKFILLRDSVRDKLQQRQQAQTDFSSDTQQLFSPITKATSEVKTATERAIYGDIPKEGKRREVSVIGVLDKIAAETEKTQQGIQQLSGDLQTQREIQQMGDIDIGTISEPENLRFSTQGVFKEKPKRSVPFIDKFTEEAIEEIRRVKLEKSEDHVTLGDFAIQSYYSRGKFLKDEYKKTVIKKTTGWIGYLKLKKEILAI